MLGDVCHEVISKIGRRRPTLISDEALPGNKIHSSIKNKYKKKKAGYGSSKNRSAQQAKAARDAIAEVQKKLKCNAVEVWTDGSSIGNPGPAGAGLLIKAEGRKRGESFFLGNSTNQAAELWAIGAAMERVSAAHSAVEIHIFTDSQFSINCLKRVWHTSKYFHLIELIRAMMGRYGWNLIKFHHVAGHADIADNEKVDKLAKEGADFSVIINTNLDLINIAKEDGFCSLSVT